MRPNRKITKRFTKKFDIVKLLIDNIFIERLGFRVQTFFRRTVFELFLI